jgi:hypothetical protein
MRVAPLVSVIVYALIAAWYVGPWLKQRSRAEALIALLWVNVFRYVVVYVFAAPHDGYPISETAATQLYVGDLAGAGLAFVAILLLRRRTELGVVVAWLLIVETLVDVGIGIYQRAIEAARPTPIGVWWLVFTFFAPMILVSLSMLGWQLVSRRGEALGDVTGAPRAAGHPAPRA